MRSLPWRQGEKPKTNYGLPHEQLDQNPPPDIYAKLKDRAYDFPFVERRPSIISVPLWLKIANTVWPWTRPRIAVISRPGSSAEFKSNTVRSD